MNKLEVLRYLVVAKSELLKANLESEGLKGTPGKYWPPDLQEEYQELMKDFARFRILGSLRDGKKS
jgi:hypothetical protein